MTDPRRQAYHAYIRRLADLLALRDWHVIVRDAPPADPDATASIRMVYGRKIVNVYLSDDFLDDPPEERRHTIAHELIHCHLEPACGVALDGIPADAAPAFRRLLEYGVDGLADGIAPLLPLPGGPEGGGGGEG